MYNGQDSDALNFESSPWLDCECTLLMAVVSMGRRNTQVEPDLH
jgi:hypothetical protein